MIGKKKNGAPNYKMCFPKISCDLRTDREFAAHEYIGTHQHGASIFDEIPGFGCVSDVPLDYMHLVCLGIMKRLISLWLSEGPTGRRLDLEKLSKLQDALDTVHKSLPQGFNKPNSIVNYVKWKAHDFRQFLLYSGPVVLQGILDDQCYKNFLLLSIAIRILVCPSLCRIEEMVNYAENLLRLFVREYRSIYGRRFVTHNIHLVIHLPNDVRKYGSLDVFGAYRFENHIGKLRQLLRKGEKPLQQIDRRIQEMKYLNVEVPKKIEGVAFQDISNHYVNDSSTISIFRRNSAKIKDSYVLTKNNEIVRAFSFAVDELKGNFLLGKKCNILRNLFENPTPSSNFNIGLFEEVSSDHVNLEWWPFDIIKSKICKVEFSQNEHVFLPILHSYEY